LDEEFYRVEWDLRTLRRRVTAGAFSPGREAAASGLGGGGGGGRFAERLGHRPHAGRLLAEPPAPRGVTPPPPAAVSAPRPAPAPCGRFTAFASPGEGGTTLCLFESASSRPRLSLPAVRPGPPFVFSPDGRSLAFSTAGAQDAIGNLVTLEGAGLQLVDVLDG